MKFKIAATIPTHQYANIQPEFEVEAKTFEEAQAMVMPHLTRIWNMYAEPGKQLQTDNSVKLKAFVGGEINYDDIAHIYFNDLGERYESGSQYAEKFREPFDAERIVKAMEKKSGVAGQEILDMWEMKADISKGFGTAIHKAMEMYGRFDGVAAKLDKTTHLHDHPIIKNIVESFYKAHKDEKAVYEALVVSHKAKRAGTIDRILITGRKKCRIQDYKTNASIEKSLSIYWKQLEFYKSIMEDGGWKVEGLDIFHHNGEEWITYNDIQKTTPTN